jgi:hypothetical protein
MRFDASECCAALACYLTKLILEREDGKTSIAAIADHVLEREHLPPDRIISRGRTAAGKRFTPPDLRAVQRHLAVAERLFEAVR